MMQQVFGYVDSFLILILLLIVTAVLCGISYLGFGDNQRLGVANINLGLDLAGGVSIVYQAEEGSDPSSEEMEGALAVIQRRLDAKGYTEATAIRDGEDRIRVEIPGVKDASEAVGRLGEEKEILHGSFGACAFCKGAKAACRVTGGKILPGEYREAAALQRFKAAFPSSDGRMVDCR